MGSRSPCDVTRKRARTHQSFTASHAALRTCTYSIVCLRRLDPSGNILPATTAERQQASVVATSDACLPDNNTERENAHHTESSVEPDEGQAVIILERWKSRHSKVDFLTCQLPQGTATPDR